MTKALSASVALLVALIAAPLADAQTALTATTLSAAVDSQTRTLPVASTSSILAGYIATIDNEGFSIVSVNSGAGNIVIAPRGYAGTLAMPHLSGSMVLVGPPAAFIGFDPSGSCTNGSGLFAYSPIVNLKNGNQWLCSSVTGKVVPGYGNVSAPPAPTTAVASAAGKVTPSGPIFHITGTSAITGFNIPVGFDPTDGGQICAIPDGIFTTTNANNFAIASTAVVSKLLCWQYDPKTGKFYPSY